MAELKEVINYLTRDVEFWDNYGGKIAQIPRADYDQALVLLKEQPPAGDFTKEFRQHLERERKSMGFAIWTQAKEACKILDRQAAQLKAKDELLFAYESVRAPKQPPAGDFTKECREIISKWGCLDQKESKDLCDRLDRSEASRKELLIACEKVQDWLDTSSLQQVLVHYTEDKRKHALIMGIASHLERLEAAIKANSPYIEHQEK